MDPSVAAAANVRSRILREIAARKRGERPGQHFSLPVDTGMLESMLVDADNVLFALLAGADVREVQ